MSSPVKIANEKIKKRIAVSVAAFFIFSALSFTDNNGLSWQTLSKQEFSSIFKKQEKLNKDIGSYSVNVKHASYENHTAAAPHEQSEGYFHKSGSSYRSSMLGMMIIQNSKIKLVIDTGGKHIMIADPDKAFEYMDSDKLEQSLLVCDNIKSRISDNGRIYRIEYQAGSPFAAAEYTTAKSGMINKIVLFYNEFETQEKWSELSQKIKPRVEITYTDFKKNVKFEKDAFSESKYTTLRDGKYVAAGDYKNYKVFDTRFPKQ